MKLTSPISGISENRTRSNCNIKEVRYKINDNTINTSVMRAAVLDSHILQYRFEILSIDASIRVIPDATLIGAGSVIIAILPALISNEKIERHCDDTILFYIAQLKKK